MALFRSIPSLEFRSSFDVWQELHDHSHIKSPEENVNFCHTEEVFSYLKNIKVKSVDSVDEVQCPSCDWDGELVVEDLAVQLSLEHLRFPRLPQTSRHLRKETIQK